MDLLNEFHNLTSNPHQYALDWKAKNSRKVVGILCSNIPEELIYAAGALPVRLLGANEPENITRPYIFSSGFCSFARDCFAQALQGRYKYLDGIIFSQCCPHAREVFIDWKRHVPIEYTYEISGPMSLQNPHAKEFLTQELRQLQTSLENWIGHQIALKDIDNAIDTFNTNRKLMNKIYRMIVSDTSGISEADAAEIALAGMLIDRREHNLLLEKILGQMPQDKRPVEQKPRLILLGSVNNNLELIRFIDTLGGRVVVDDYCTGYRYYQTEIVNEEDRLAAIAGRLINKPPCPLHDLPDRKRISYYAKLVDQYKIDGAIYTMQRQCDAHGLDYPAVETFFKTKEIPMLKLELDYTVPTGQFRTRIEAFLEMLTNR